MIGTSEHGNEHSRSIKCWKFLISKPQIYNFLIWRHGEGAPVFYLMLTPSYYIFKNGLEYICFHGKGVTEFHLVNSIQIVMDIVRLANSGA